MLEGFGLSDAGCVRPNNEDYFISDTASGIFVLADGMGGANAGEYASRLSAEKVYEVLLSSPNDHRIEALEHSFVEANRAVREAARANPELDGMGTTLLAVRAVHDGEVQVASVGDSRAYLCSNREFSLITHDQTWVNEVGSQLGLTDEALRKHPMRHVLTMAVGSMDELRVDCRPLHLNSGDQILLCSDGLHGVLEEKILHQTLDSQKSLPEKCHYLVDAARQTGGPDNITVVLIQLM
ncbi:MAG: serine/threonine-protein phosphatase [Acidobacteriaceae bacterium]|nr:serine/threonine-protein phosphatase [Acidobacteriaceae bacterium]MBV9781809.1 serine/threonine-protein phosphatase [Acidobacteriaceae bacterium]